MSDFTLPLPRKKRGGILKKDDNNTVIGVPFETSTAPSASRASLNRSKRRVSFAPEATMTTFENLTPLRNFASNQERVHVTQSSFGGFSKPGFGAVVDWKDERERVREEKEDKANALRQTTSTTTPALLRDSTTSRDQPVVAAATARDANHRQSLSTIFGNFRPSRDSFTASESFSESREYDASVNLSRDLSNPAHKGGNVVKTSFKELFQRAMSKSRESGARDSLLLGIARDRNSILGHVATNTLVEEDESGEVEMELTEVALRDKSGLREISGLRENSGSRDSPPVNVVASHDTSLASPVKAEEDDGMDFTNVPRGERTTSEENRDSFGSRGSNSRDSGEMDFTNLTLARDIAEARAADQSGMNFTNVRRLDDSAMRTRALSRISEHDSDGMEYASASIPSVARIVSEEVLVRSGLSPGGSPRVREIGNESMDFTNVPRSSMARESPGMDFTNGPRTSQVADNFDMDFTNVPGGGRTHDSAQFAIPATPAPVRVRADIPDDNGDMSFTNVPRRGSIYTADTPRGIKRRRVDDGADMEFTEVAGITADSSAMDFTVPVTRPDDTSAMDFTVPAMPVSAEAAAPTTNADTSVMDFTGPVDMPVPATNTEDASMEFTKPVKPVSGPVVETSAMEFTVPDTPTIPDTSAMDFTRPVDILDDGQVEMSFTRPVEVPNEQDDGEMSFTHPVDAPQEEEVDMSFTRPVEVPAQDDNMSFTNTNITNVTNMTRSTATGTGLDVTRPVPGGIEVGDIEVGETEPSDEGQKSPKSKLTRDRRVSRDDHTDYEFTTFGQQLDSSTRLLSQMRNDDMEKSLEEPLEEPPRDDHVPDHHGRVAHVIIPLADDVSTPEYRNRPLSAIAETTEREDSAGGGDHEGMFHHPVKQGVTVATNSGTFGTQFSTPFSTPATTKLSTPGKRPFSELSRDETPERSLEDGDDGGMDHTAPMSLRHRFELLSTPRKVKVKRGGAEFGSRIGNSVSRDHKSVLSRVGDLGSPAVPSDSLTMTRFLQMIDMQFMDDFLLPGKRQPNPDVSKCSLAQYLVNSYLHPHVQLYSWAVEHLRKDIEVRSANFAQLDQETLNDVPPIFVDYTSADSGVKLLLNKQFALDKQYYRVEARKSWYEWRKSISIDLYKRLATNRDLLRSDLKVIDQESETVSTEVADLKQSLDVSNSQLTQLKNLSTDVELKRQVCSELQLVQQQLMPLVDKLEQVNLTVVELESEVAKEVQKQDEIKTQLMEQQKRLLDNRHIDFREIEQLQEQLKKTEQKKGLKLARFEPNGDAVFESRDLCMTVSRNSNLVVAISAMSSLSDDKRDAVKLLPLGQETIAGITKTWSHVTQFFDALSEIKLAFNSRYHVTSDGHFELFIKLLTHKGQSRTDVNVRFPFSEIRSYPNMPGCHVTSKCVYGVNSGVSFTTFDACLEVLLSVR
ncbi:YALIA101S06e06084g1_1 [Yarrowia lipolytica]|nr:Kinetochore protein spc7 [Yarrowia lipolytica]SEI35274.1 YALIA101S06e06084g1_1 [Yarrowia lipolytica]